MIKRLLRRIKERRLKRTTFMKMFLKAMILPVIVTVILGKIFPVMIRMSALEHSCRQMQEYSYGLERRIANVYLGKLPFQYFMCYTGDIDVRIEGGRLVPSTWIEPSGYSVSFTFDENGRILHSNRAKMFVFVNYGKQPEKYSEQYKTPEYDQLYTFDPLEHDIPELNSLFDDHFKEKRSDGYLMLRIKSLYVNEAEQKMIPHEILVKKGKYDYGFMDYGYVSDEQIYPLEADDKEAYEVTINADVEGYELLELDRNDGEVYPKCGNCCISGVEPAVFDREAENCRKNIEYIMNKKTSRLEFSESDPYLMNDSSGIIQKYDTEQAEGIKGYLSMIHTDLKGIGRLRRFYFYLGILFGFMTLIAFLSCWSMNVKNKARYEFEDYQRALTNNLAHDLKTPLAVIGGYAENLMEMRRDSGSEKELKYLGSIMKNVAYTDDIIAKTLELSKTEQSAKLNRKKVDIKALAEKSAEKYRTVLEEKEIELITEGSGEVSADEDILEAAVENLISNAVKYTSTGGKISVTADNKRLCVVNDVEEDIDTKDLLMPFVKGDKARSDKQSHGLGLAIASAAAAQNGFRLKIDCRDRKFTAVIDF